MVNMKIYMSIPDTVTEESAELLSPPLGRVFALLRAGILDSDSAVWLNLHRSDPLMWTLADRSTCMYVHQTPVAGLVRIYKNKIHWGVNYNKSLNDAPVKIALSELPVTGDRRFTFVVHSFDPSKEVTVLDGSVRKDLSAGSYTTDDGSVTIIDASHYTKLLSVGMVVGAYEDSHAYCNGTEFLMEGLSTEERKKVMADPEEYCYDIADDRLSQYVTVSEGLNEISKEIYKNYISSHKSFPNASSQLYGLPSTDPYPTK